MVAVADLVLFTPHSGHHHILPAIFQTAKGADAVLPQYAAIAGEVNSDGTADLFVLVPNKEGVWMENVPEGTGEFTWAAKRAVNAAAAMATTPANDPVPAAKADTAAKAPTEAAERPVSEAAPKG